MDLSFNGLMQWLFLATILSLGLYHRYLTGGGPLCPTAGAVLNTPRTRAAAARRVVALKLLARIRGSLKGGTTAPLNPLLMRLP